MTGTEEPWQGSYSASVDAASAKAGSTFAFACYPGDRGDHSAESENVLGNRGVRAVIMAVRGFESPVATEAVVDPLKLTFNVNISHLRKYGFGDTDGRFRSFLVE